MPSEVWHWLLWRHDPRLEAGVSREAVSPGYEPHPGAYMPHDSKEPDWTKFEPFLMGEVRYNSLAKENPDHFKELFTAAQNNAKWRLAGYKRMAAQSWEAPAQ